ncbi:MAG: hypothetical protein IPM79_12640 [Polyangiaceae bacterium]|nr:hypothetical protein [Polyangiaceae bacterium]MBK8938453.1 hypothetical protein [Polyangiaceae bacterium]
MLRNASKAAVAATGFLALTALAGCPDPLKSQVRQVEIRYVTPISVCRNKLPPVGDPSRAGSAVRDLDPGQWLEVLVPGYTDGDEQGLEALAVDCTGSYLFANESLRGGASDRGWPRFVDPDEMTLNSGPNGMRVLWLRALKFENGDEGGPIALSRAYGDNAEIYGVGSFRGPKNTKFQTARIGNETIVVAESKECDPETQTCRKRGHFFLPRRGRLIESTVVDLDRVQVMPSATQRGLYAQYHLSTDVTYQKDGILLLERVSVRIAKTEVPDLDSDRELRAVEFSRFLKIERDTMFSSNEPLWERVVGRD